MSCCSPAEAGLLEAATGLPRDEEMRLASRALGNGMRQVELSVPAVHCAACIGAIEKGLGGLEGVVSARVNLSSRRVTVQYRQEVEPPLVATLVRLGYPPHLLQDQEAEDGAALRELLRAVAVSGFAAANIMLLSVSVWSGADGATRDLFHWISALIALPALAFAGRIYYRSAWSALRVWRMNMDVAIAIGVTMAYLLSIYETLTHGPHAYFDASVSLLFFLLIGRTLDHVMRNRARSAVQGLARLSSRGAVVVTQDGAREYRPVADIEPGSLLLVAAGERIPVDAIVEQGSSDLDVALISGESRPVSANVGNTVRAGTLNLTGPLTLKALKSADQSFLAEMIRLMEAAEGGRARYRRIAERVSSLYAPVVHVGALLTFIGWMLADGDWHRAITIAIAVLIITCPCALGLAVPIVQVVAARRLFEAGIMVKDGAALERMAEADAVVFDKTGTLTLGQPTLVDPGSVEPDVLAIAAEIAAHSRHPYSRAIAAYAHLQAPVMQDVREVPGFGVEGRWEGSTWRLGRAVWAAADEPGISAGTILGRDGRCVARFRFDDALRSGAAATVAALARDMGPATVLSGDTEASCLAVADRLGILSVEGGLAPSEKVARIEAMAEGGRKVLMVGDGLNDAPALAAAHVSMAPSTAADVGRNAADFVFLRDDLSAVMLTRDVSRRAGRLIRQNIAFAILYNAVAVPIAVLGHVTPLIAAVAMSTSSLIVIANALRLSSATGAVASGEANASARGKTAGAAS